MAKVVYTKSPIEHEREILEGDDLVGQEVLEVLRELNLEDASISVSINGHTPEEFDTSYVLEEGDLLEIRRIVAGGGPQAKQNLATLVQVIALVAVFATGAGAIASAAILMGGSLIAGALNREAMRLMQAGLSPQDQTEQDISSNRYSDVTSSNQITPMAPIPLVMGEHRVTPELHAPPMSFPGQSDYTQFASGGAVVSEMIPSQMRESGPDGSIDRWIDIPRGFMNPGASNDTSNDQRFPYYDIKVAPYGFYSSPEPISNAKKTEIRNTLYGLFHVLDINGNPRGFPSMDYNNLFITAFPVAAYPLVIYHSDPQDPFYRRFNTINTISKLWEIWRDYKTGGSPNFPSTFSQYYNAALNGVFNGTRVVTGVSASMMDRIFFEPGIDGPMFLAPNFGLFGPYYIPNTINASDSSTTVFTKFGNFLRDLNGGSYNTSPKTNGLQYKAEKITPAYLIDTKAGRISTGDPVPFAYHVFNYGIGDIEVSERRVGGIGVPGISEINKPDSSETVFPWAIKDQWVTSPIVEPTSDKYPFHVTQHEDLKLRNTSGRVLVQDPGAGEDSGSFSQNDEESIEEGFSIFMGDYGQNSCQFYINGYLYSTGQSGIETNSTALDIQWKLEREDGWRPYTDFPGRTVIHIESDTTKPFSIWVVISADHLLFTEDDRLKVRVRKVIPDSQDNDGYKVSDINIRSVNFYQSLQFADASESNLRWAPMNLEGLYLDAKMSETGVTNRFSALVESKCWHWDFETEEWVWGKTANPAWWFLYYARGGFLNLGAYGDGQWPLSPTKGWYNYKAADGNTERIFGAGLLNEEIDIEKIKEWAAFCEENELEFSLVLRDDTSVASVLDRIANVGRASVSYYNGLLSVVIEDKAQSPTGLYGMANMIAGSFRVDYAVGPMPRKIIARYINRESWSQESVEATVPFSDPESTDVVEMVLEGITSKEQAQREVNIAAARQFYQRRTYTWQTDVEGYYAKRGDLVFLSHDSTQYGFSGRVIRFEGNSIVAGSVLDDSIKNVTIRYPTGELETLSCSVEGQVITFDDPFPDSKKPFHMENGDLNQDSEFTGSYAEDFIFIAGEMETPGKLVRISEVQVNEDEVFTFTAVDEDPAMWAYEFNTGEPEEGGSFDNSEIVLEVWDAAAQRIDDRKVLISWNIGTGDFVQLIDVSTSSPIESGGRYSFSGSSLLIDYSGPGEIEIVPLTLGSAFKSISKKVSFD